MKKYLLSAGALVLLAAMLFGCGMKNVSEHPGGIITDPTDVMPTIIPEPSMTSPTENSGATGAADPSRYTEPTHTVPDGTTGTEPSGATAGTDPTDAPAGKGRASSRW